ncbi:hypothetical protein EMIHUDRAFT_429574 [Emiliania huxleyi CCMP1516]|uniref:PCI domain-containing protein n=2 Tax=Emiliania huxleyi TaxID=2903 RepID=A0A0D3K9W7_EMIH1|nr:hypothetical protein EMIHUDRAFT_429574 [Emiliania huxleyi CCMP1516]EOD32552.1 hypothetical protein EMIHUDRAFT_429574 [Emiliania huxleyi CCMP1516]|eukprot:XP_005784981.1 hypothetical protein EMIHUDRAFT_429574 [Emiliania huxleyi CCMP1516]
MSSSRPSSEMESYIAAYAGHTRLKRLQFIAQHEPTLRAEALRIAVEQARQGVNTALYQELCATEGCPVARDDAWVDSVEKKASARLDKLESDLASHKTSLVKESIRMGHSDLGDFHASRGDFATALKCYVRTRDYCTTSRHTLSMCLAVVKAPPTTLLHPLPPQSPSNVSPFISKPSPDAVLTAQLRALTALEAKKFRAAARKFVEVSVELGTTFSEVCSVSDVALYGALCALAAFDRAELSERVVKNSAFRSMLELYPEAREIVHDFHSSRYASCLAALETLRRDASLANVPPSAPATRPRHALVQYFSPFVAVDLCRMASAFNVEVDSLEKEIAALIMSGCIPARIDSQAKVLHARHADQRNATFVKALATGEAYMRDTKALLLRLNLLRADFAVKGSGDSSGPSKSSRQERAEARAFGGA